jgi:RNA polymerase sigma-70 factor (TIGR02960 family)
VNTLIAGTGRASFRTVVHEIKSAAAPAAISERPVRPGRAGVLTGDDLDTTGRCEDLVQSDALGEARLARARAGDEEAFRELTEPHRRELQLHCYRILGSVQDAEDMVQETLLAAWRSLEAFEGRASVRAWLYRIATNRCLNALRAWSVRPREVQAMSDALEPTRRTEPVWLEPYPDRLFEGIPDRSAGPAARYEARESIELSFIVALQHLPPRQRAALVLADVLGFRSAEVARMLDTGEASVKGALQRARATLRQRLPAADRERAPVPDSVRERELVGRFADAVHGGDVDEIVSLLTDDALLTMPPQPLEYQGHDAIAAFLRHRAELRGAPLRVVPIRANTQPAFGCYLPDAHAAIVRPYGLLVLTLAGDAIAAITWFTDTAVFRHFGLPRTLPG